MSGIQTPPNGRNPLNVLQDDIALALMAGASEGEPLPMVEAPSVVIKYYNKDKYSAVEKLGYFIMNGVIVCLEGRKEDVRKALNRSLDFV